MYCITLIKFGSNMVGHITVLPICDTERRLRPRSCLLESTGKPWLDICFWVGISAGNRKGSYLMTRSDPAGSGSLHMSVDPPVWWSIATFWLNDGWNGTTYSTAWSCWHGLVVIEGSLPRPHDSTMSSSQEIEEVEILMVISPPFLISCLHVQLYSSHSPRNEIYQSSHNRIISWHGRGFAGAFVGV